MIEPEIGQRFALPSTNVIEVVRTFAITPMVGCKYIRAVWPRNRSGARACDSDMILSLDFIARHGRPI